jgi:hypothetical protein
MNSAQPTIMSSFLFLLVLFNHHDSGQGYQTVARDKNSTRPRFATASREALGSHPASYEMANEGSFSQIRRPEPES